MLRVVAARLTTKANIQLRMVGNTAGRCRMVGVLLWAMTLAAGRTRTTRLMMDGSIHCQSKAAIILLMDEGGLR